MASSAHRAQVGEELRRIRESLDVSGARIAEELGWSQSKVSRIETARISVSVQDLGTLLRHYGVAEEVRAELLTMTAEDAGLEGAWVLRAGGPPRRHSELVAIESRVTRIRQHHPFAIPGQLQSTEYAQELARAAGFADPEGIADRRRQRQWQLEESGAPVFDVVLGAQALLTWPKDRAVIDGQFDFLRQRAALPTVRLRIVPLGVGRIAIGTAAFIIYDFTAANSPPVVFHETQTADLYLSSATDLAAHERLFDRLCAEALDPQESLRYLDHLATRMGDIESMRPVPHL